MSGIRSAAAMVVLGSEPPTAAVVNWVMKSAFGMFSEVTVTSGYCSANRAVICSRPTISESLVK